MTAPAHTRPRLWRENPPRTHDHTCTICQPWTAERWRKDTAIGPHDNEGPRWPWLHGKERT